MECKNLLLIKLNRCVLPEEVLQDLCLSDWSFYSDDLSIQSVLLRLLLELDPSYLDQSELPLLVKLALKAYYLPSAENSLSSIFPAGTPVTALDLLFEYQYVLQGFFSSEAFPLDWVMSRSEELLGMISQKEIIIPAVLRHIHLLGLQKSLQLFRQVQANADSQKLGPVLLRAIIRYAEGENEPDLFLTCFRAFCENPGNEPLSSARANTLADLQFLFHDSKKLAHPMAAILAKHHPIFKMEPLDKSDVFFTFIGLYRLETNELLSNKNMCRTALTPY